MKCIQKLGMALMLCLGVVTATGTAVKLRARD